MVNGTDDSAAPSPQLLVAGQAEPRDVIAQQAAGQDYLVLRIAVIGLIVAVLAALAGVVFLAWSGEKETALAVLAIGSAGVGALATMLVRPPPAAN